MYTVWLQVGVRGRRGVHGVFAQWSARRTANYANWALMQRPSRPAMRRIFPA